MPANRVVHVIDDDAAVRQSLAFLLSTAGLAVRVHASAVDFLKVLPEIQGGCIVTDGPIRQCLRVQPLFPHPRRQSTVRPPACRRTKAAR